MYLISLRSHPVTLRLQEKHFWRNLLLVIPMRLSPSSWNLDRPPECYRDDRYSFFVGVNLSVDDGIYR